MTDKRIRLRGPESLHGDLIHHGFDIFYLLSNAIDANGRYAFSIYEVVVEENQYNYFRLIFEDYIEPKV